MKDDFEDFDIDTESLASSKDFHSFQVYIYVIICQRCFYIHRHVCFYMYVRKHVCMYVYIDTKSVTSSTDLHSSHVNTFMNMKYANKYFFLMGSFIFIHVCIHIHIFTSVALSKDLHH
jgi:hypothetical protein